MLVIESDFGFKIKQKSVYQHNIVQSKILYILFETFDEKMFKKTIRNNEFEKIIKLKLI